MPEVSFLLTCMERCLSFPIKVTCFYQKTQNAVLLVKLSLLINIEHGIHVINKNDSQIGSAR